VIEAVSCMIALNRFSGDQRLSGRILGEADAGRPTVPLPHIRRDVAIRKRAQAPLKGF
jgi:hypothetical protein